MWPLSSIVSQLPNVRGMLRHLFLASLILLCGCAATAKLSPEELRARLVVMGERDQATMSDTDSSRREIVLRAQASELRKIISVHGWPKISVVGREASEAAWLVAQHSDFDRSLQREALASMELLASSSEVIPKHIGYLHDQIAVGEGRLQTYGTQGRCVGGKWEPFPIAEPDSIDSRRKSLSMEPLETYKAVGSSLFCSSHGQ